MADGEVNGDVRELRQMLADCEQYLKEDETPAQRIERERRDTEAVLNLLIREKRKTEELSAEVDRLHKDAERHQFLRRQHEVIKELVDSVQVAVDSDLGRLWAWPDSSKETWMKNARAALARAKEQR